MGHKFVCCWLIQYKTFLTAQSAPLKPGQTVSTGSPVNRQYSTNSAPIFRSPTLVSLLSWFPETPTMNYALFTHNATGFVFNKCAVPTMHFALYTQSKYTPIMQFALITHHASGFSFLHPIAIYTHNAYRIIHPHCITHCTPIMHIGFVLNLCAPVSSVVFLVLLLRK